MNMRIEPHSASKDALVYRTCGAVIKGADLDSPNRLAYC